MEMERIREVPSGSEQAGPGRKSRIGLWMRLRDQKRDRIEPERLTKAERIFLWLEDEISEATPKPALEDVEFLLGIDKSGMLELPMFDAGNRLFPQVGNIRSRSGIGGGAVYRETRREGLPVDLEASAAVTFRGYQSYRGRIGRILSLPGASPLARHLRNDDGETFFWYGSLRHDRYLNETFFGLGGDSSLSNRSIYSFYRSAVEAVAGYRFESGLTVAARTGWVSPRIGSGAGDDWPDVKAAFPAGSVPGLHRQPNFHEVSLAAYFDTGDEAGHPRRRAFVGSSYHRFHEVGEAPLDFQRFLLDARGYLPLGSPSRILALRALGSFDDRLQGEAIPFYLQRTLGDGSTLRGFSDQRFRGDKLLHLSAEYRWEAAPAVELALFVDAGQAHRHPEPIALKDFRGSHGIGVRLKTENATFFRIDVARSHEEIRFHITTSHPF
jgi:hypothetical protein